MSGVDQLFDRFGDLLKSWVNSDDQEQRPFSDPGKDASSKRHGDPFLDDAMDELNAFLDDDREAQERLRQERESRAKAEDRARASRSGTQYRPSGPPPKLLEAYKTLGLAYGAPFDAAKAAYKRLLKEHHPDKHGSSPESQKKATEKSARINDAWRILETWHETGTLGDE
jgi:cell division septum initiation protein DivIVA